MKALPIIGVVILAIFFIVILAAAFLPSAVHVERSIVIKAAPPTVFEQINNLKKWEKWSPWYEKDTTAEMVYEGPEKGEGAIHKWKSNNAEVGTGVMMITQSSPVDSVSIRLEMAKQGVSKSSFIFEKSGEGTKVTWGMTADMGRNPIKKYFGLLMDKMLGKEFEHGLDKLKTVAESIPVTPPIKVSTSTVTTHPILFIRDKTTRPEVSNKLMEIYTEIKAQIEKAGAKQTGAPYAIYFSYTPVSVELEAGIPVDKAVKPFGRVKAGEMKGGNVASAEYMGAYHSVKNAHIAVQEFLKKNELKLAGTAWEEYITDPSTEKDTAKWVTKVFYPVE